jgi:drug/metabolite transporter (DMT)-like permease
VSGIGLGHAALAFLATTVYYVAFIIFKMAATRMPPLRGSRPFNVLRHMLTDWAWWSGVMVLLIGMVYQVQVFRSLPLSVAQPLFASSLIGLLAFAAIYFGERLSSREWLSVALFGGATLLVGLSSESEQKLTEKIAPVTTILAVAAPALLVAVLVWIVGDRRSNGRHARRIAGVAYGVGAGACFGMAEVGIKGVAAVYSETRSVTAVLNTPHPYLIVVMAGVALVQLQIALQRCRISIITSVLTVIAKTQLVITGTLVYSEAWPRDPMLLGLRTAGFTLALAALVLFPRHEGPRPSVASYRPAPRQHGSVRRRTAV